MTPDPAMLHAVAEATWPPAATQTLGPVTLRDGKGGGKRVSAAPTFSLRAGAAAGVFSGAQDTAQWLSMLEQCAEQVA